MIYVIGDTQSKPKVKNPLKVIAHHIAECKPEHVVHLGDHWDLPSLSHWDKGKKSQRPKTYLKDMQAGNKAMMEFWEILFREWPQALEECEFILLGGNHEDRRRKAIEFCEDHWVDLITSVEFNTKHWHKVIPFLKIHKIKGIEFSHYFSNSNSARPIDSARLLLNKRHVSCVAGHKQGFDYAEQLQGDSKTIQSLIVGSSYYHDEDYKNHTNHHWRGTVLLHTLKTSTGFDFSRFSMDTLDMMYGELV